MSVTGMLAAVAKAAAMETDEKKDDEMEDCSPNPDDPNYSPDCDCGGAPSKSDEADAVAFAVKAERTRILSIAAAAFPGQDKLCASLIESGATIGDAALAFNADHKARGAKILASIDADEAAVKGLRPEPANGCEPQKSPLAGLSGEGLWKAEFQGSADLQAEFGGKEAAYLAFKRAEASGQARILNKNAG